MDAEAALALWALLEWGFLKAEGGRRNAESGRLPQRSAFVVPRSRLLAVRRRLSAAAARRGWVLAFLPTEGEQLVFRVREVVGA